MTAGYTHVFCLLCVKMISTRSPSRATILLACGLYAAGCRAESSRTAGFEVRDSLGVEIVESFAPVLTGSRSWTIDPDPILEIGALDAAEPYVFSRIWDATRLSDGRVVVVDELTTEIRVFDGRGRHLGTFGRVGDGPNEFGGPPFVESTDDDELVVWDGGHVRLSRFDAEGTLIDQVGLQAELSELGILPFRNGRVWQIDAEGRLLATGPQRPRSVEGLRDSYRRVVLVWDRGASNHDFGVFVSGQSFVVRVDRTGVGVGNPYAPAPAAALVGNGIAISGDAGWELRIHETNGNLRRILRAAIPRTPVTAELEQRALDRAREMADVSPITLAQAEDAFAQISLPDSVPIVGSIMASPGALWVGRRTGWWWEIGDYDVFDADGRWLTTVRVPREVEMIHEIGEDYILAHVVDELEVPYLRLYRIHRSE